MLRPMVADRLYSGGVYRPATLLCLPGDRPTQRLTGRPTAKVAYSSHGPNAPRGRGAWLRRAGSFVSQPGGQHHREATEALHLSALTGD